jgi:hypothetical protein
VARREFGRRGYEVTTAGTSLPRRALAPAPSIG